ncbi:MAG: pyridoxal-phosphate dependent enzyme [Deltaproteobacteria bacterium]|nr:pyridoxal-phosphate dependent enzyme [Deltaproteobacteria bacterium]
MALTLDALEGLPRAGFVAAASPLEAVAVRGVTVLVKRDDALTAGFGGTKMRKLDHLLAAPPWAGAASYASVGAVGSGHLVALIEAARMLGRRVDAHLFAEPVSEGVLDNLRYTVSGAAGLAYYGSRLELGVRHPALIFGARLGEAVVVPPGASCAEATVGVVRGALELAAQLRERGMEAPSAVYVAFGSGGTAAGLAVGLGLAGMRTQVRAVATVERVFSPAARLHALVEATRGALRAAGVPGVDDHPPVPLHIIRGQLGRAYGHPTRRSLAAVEEARALGLPMEPVYTGKAFAALLRELAAPPRNVDDTAPAAAPPVFWNTTRGRVPGPVAPDWEARLPRRLARALAPVNRGRRALLWGSAVTAAGAVVGWRAMGYARFAGWQGAVLGPREAEVLAAAAEALFPLAEDGVAAADVVRAVDRFLVSTTPAMKNDIHLMLGALEQLLPVVGLSLARFSRLPPPERLALLERLQDLPGEVAQVPRGVRDLCAMGHYQADSSWRAIGYTGPFMPRSPDMRPPHVAESWRAPPGKLPGSAR